MVVIRLARCGAKHRPKYRITVADSRRSAVGKYLDIIGHFDPLSKNEKTSLSIDLDMAKSWIAKGAQPTRRVKSLMSKVEAAT